MTPSMTPSIALPSRVSFSDRLRPHRNQLLGGLGLGLATELLLDGSDFGLGHAIFGVLVAGFIVVSAGKEAWQSAAGHRWLLLAAVLLLGSTMLHDAGWLAVMSTISSALLFALAIQGWNGERKLSALRTGHLFGAPFKTAGQSLFAGAVVTSRQLEDTNVTGTVNKYAPSLLRLMIIVLPPVGALTLLLSSGDAVFRARIDSLDALISSIPLSGFLRGGFVTLISGLSLTGVLALVSRRKDDLTPSVPGRPLRAFESFTLLGTLTSLLFVYGLTSTPCALAPAACTLPRGVTYADAAHEGFFQLLFAAIGILLLLMALPARTQLESKKAQLTFTALSTALVLATMPMMISGAARLWRYESIYGLTVLRLLAYAGLMLVGAVLAWRALTLWTLNDAFVGGAIGLFTTTMLGLAVLSPDKYIAERNVVRPEVDVWYLARLSADALPALVEFQSANPTDDDVALRYRAERLGPSESLLTWNLGRWRARRALQGLIFNSNP
ncbi:MAG: DUF4173 domain-containing protein [Archangium sp.]|nr:DUF4173 domain-containing protein [Archangium sp.]